MTRRILLTVLVLGTVGSVAGFGAYSAFTATTTNAGNTITAGTVEISQHAGAATLYSLTNQGPGASTTKCVRVTYTGSLAASVKLYVSAGVTNGTVFNLQVERGSGLTTLDNTMSCAGFTASSTAYATAAIGSLGTTYAGGVDGKAGAAAWATNDSIDYRFTISIVDDATPNAHTSALSTAAHTFTWEARNN